MEAFNLLVFILILLTISNIIWVFAYYVSRRTHKAAQDVIVEQRKQLDRKILEINRMAISMHQLNVMLSEQRVNGLEDHWFNLEQQYRLETALN